MSELQQSKTITATPQTTTSTLTPTIIPYEKQIEILKNKKTERAKINALIALNTKEKIINQEIIKKRCKSSFHFWCDNFAWIQDPESDDPEKKDIPFLLYDYQDKAAEAIVDAITKGYDLPIEKSRKMGLSWLLMAILVWGWHFHEWECLVGSQKGENVDKKGNIKSLMEKARYIIQRQPKFLFPILRDKVDDKYMMLGHPVSGATIAGEANNTDFGRSDRRKVVLFDEFASWKQTDKAAWQACGSTTKCRIPLSTPNTRGTNCHYYTIIKDTKKKEKPSLYLHWTLNPVFAKNLYYDDYDKPRSPWYDNEAKRSSSPQEVAQELDIDYDASMGDKVFPGFKTEVNVDENIEYDEDLPLYIAWDFGLDQTAILWIQHDYKKNVFNIIDEYVNDGSGTGTDIYHYIDIVQAKEYKKAIHFGDPQSGENRSLTSGTSNANVLRRYGMIFRSQRTRVVNRINAGRNLLPSMRVSPKCTLTIEMFISWGMVIPRSGNTSAGSVPEHNEFSHIGEAYTYFAYNYSETFKKRKVIKKKVPIMSYSGVTV